MASERYRRVVGVRLGGAVERAHTIQHQGSYSNARHQWGVAMLLWELWPERFARLAALALTHDVGEGWVGDVPASLKVLLPDLSSRLELAEDRVRAQLGLPSTAEYSEEDQRVIRACDQLELYLWALEQSAQENWAVQDIITNLHRHWRDNPLPAPADLLAAEAWHKQFTPLTQVDVIDLKEIANDW